MTECERFWSKVERGGPDECWPYVAARTRLGYGIFARANKTGSKLAHRFADEDTNGPIPEGVCVLHRCDNLPCCNPAHLFRGTRVDNNADMRAKGRGSDPPRGDLRGTRHPLAKLTQEAVIEIRQRCANGEGVTNLARHFGVSHSLVSGVVSGKKWTWL